MQVTPPVAVLPENVVPALGLDDTHADASGEGKCPMCRGVGSYGEPPTRCEFCKLSELGKRYAAFVAQEADALAAADRESTRTPE
jgi:hypothetical protein